MALHSASCPIFRAAQSCPCIRPESLVRFHHLPWFKPAQACCSLNPCNPYCFPSTQSVCHALVDLSLLCVTISCASFLQLNHVYPGQGLTLNFSRVLSVPGSGPSMEPSPLVSPRSCFSPQAHLIFCSDSQPGLDLELYS